MDSARRLTDNEIISAEQLWEMDNPRAVAFVCPDCPVKLEPRACDKGQDWKVRPYFKRPTGAQHTDGCNMEARDKLVAEAVKKPVLTRNPPPLPVYTRLDLAQENVRVPWHPCRLRAEEFICGRVNTIGHEPTGPSTDRHNRTARTIRPICRQSADFPQDRGIRLSLPGVVANTYADVFVPIRQVTSDTGNFGRRLFYGEMRFRERGSRSGWRCDDRVQYGRMAWPQHSVCTRPDWIPNSWGRLERRRTSSGSFTPYRRRLRQMEAYKAERGGAEAKERARRATSSF